MELHSNTYHWPKIRMGQNVAIVRDNKRITVHTELQDRKS